MSKNVIRNFLEKDFIPENAIAISLWENVTAIFLWENEISGQRKDKGSGLENELLYRNNIVLKIWNISTISFYPIFYDVQRLYRRINLHTCLYIYSCSIKKYLMCLYFALSFKKWKALLTERILCLFLQKTPPNTTLQIVCILQTVGGGG